MEPTQPSSPFFTAFTGPQTGENYASSWRSGPRWGIYDIYKTAVVQRKTVQVTDSADDIIIEKLTGVMMVIDPTVVVDSWHQGVALPGENGQTSCDIRDLINMKKACETIDPSSTEVEAFISYLTNEINRRWGDESPKIMKLYQEKINSAIDSSLRIPFPSSASEMAPLAASSFLTTMEAQQKETLFALHYKEQKHSAVLTSASKTLKYGEFNGDAALSVDIGDCHLIAVADAAGHEKAGQTTSTKMLGKLQEKMGKAMTGKSVLTGDEIRKLIVDILIECHKIGLQNGGVCTLSFTFVIPCSEDQEYYCLTVCIGDAGALHIRQKGYGLISVTTLNPASPDKEYSNSGGSLGDRLQPGRQDLQCHFSIRMLKSEDIIVVGSDGVLDNLEGKTMEISVCDACHEMEKAGIVVPIPVNREANTWKDVPDVHIKYTEFVTEQAIKKAQNTLNPGLSAGAVGYGIMDHCLSSTGGSRKTDDITLAAYQLGLGRK